MSSPKFRGLPPGIQRSKRAAVRDSAHGRPSTLEYHVQAAGVSLFVREVGQGQPVVVLHGGPGADHGYLWPSFSLLADEFRLFFYDQRGGGRSPVPRPSGIGWRDHVGDLDTLRRHWELERITLVGYSWGGLLALLYATEHPARVEALALVAPAAAWGDYHRQFRNELARRSQSKILRRLRAELESSGLAESDPVAYRQRRFDLTVAGYYRQPADARDSPVFTVQLQAQQATWSSLRGHGEELRRRLQTLSLPTLILHGLYDPIPLSWAEELATVIPGARLFVLEESGHLPYLEEAERTLSVIRRFLREA
jgi:proline iminopeptidase